MAETTHRRVAAIVPCAGSSTRMGASKPMLDAGGRTFVERVVGLLRDGGCDPVVVVVRGGGQPEEAVARASGAHVVLNDDPGDGPITSIRLALRDVGDAAACVLCPVDHPLVRATTVSLLLAESREDLSALVIPTYGGKRGHPIVLPSRLFPELLEPDLAEGARTVVHRHVEQAREVPVDDPGVTADIDTLSDYRHHFPEAYRHRFQSR